MHRCHVPGASGRLVTLPADEAHHLTRVLRLGVGAEVHVFDGRGHEWQGRVSSVTRSETTIELLEARVALPEPRVGVTLAVALLKGDQMNSVVRDATMLGVAAIAPFVSDHVALPAHAVRERLSARWERIAIASAKQCGRAVVPAVHPISTLTAVLALEMNLRLACVEPAAGTTVVESAGARPTSATLCVGPEGGWSRDELECLARHDARPLRLGPRTLRAETAPTVALSALWTEWGWS